MVKKAIFFLFFISIAFARLISIENPFIKVVMDDTTGRFGIGKPNGTPYIKGFPTSVDYMHFVVRINDNFYSNNPALATVPPLFDPGRRPENYYMTIQWMRDPVRIWQKLYLLPEDSLDEFVDIEILAYNDSPDSQRIGFLLYMDYMVGTNDNPILEFPTGVVTTYRNLDSTNIPAYWTLYEVSTHQETLYAHAQGVPFGSWMIYPDLAVFADASLLERELWWLAIPSGLPLTNLAVAFRWNVIRVPPYNWYITQIYYGGGYPTFGIGEKPRQKPKFMSLGNPYPNPFNARVEIPFRIESRQQIVSWNIYDLSGKIVAHSKPEDFEPGEHKISWNCRDDLSRELPSGLYLFALFANGVRETKTLVLIK